MSSSVVSTNSNPSSIALRRTLDFIEKCILLTFYGFFVVPVLEAFFMRMDVGAGLLAISETLVIALVLYRKPAQALSQRPTDWIFAFGATISPTLVRPLAEPTWFVSLGVVLMFAGILFQILSKATLGLRFGIVAANRGICSSGTYRIVRHPIYMGYLITHIGFLCLAFSPWNLMVYTITYCFMIPRIFAEERLLRRDAEYEAYCGKTHWRLFPGVL